MQQILNHLRLAAIQLAVFCLDNARLLIKLKKIEKLYPNKTSHAKADKLHESQPSHTDQIRGKCKKIPAFPCISVSVFQIFLSLNTSKAHNVSSYTTFISNIPQPVVVFQEKNSGLSKIEAFLSKIIYSSSFFLFL